MIGPRDTPAGMPYPVNPLTKEPITDRQQMWIKKLAEASFLVRSVMHEIDGSTFEVELGGRLNIDDRYSGRNLALACTKLDECMLWAAKAVFET